VPDYAYVPTTERRQRDPLLTKPEVRQELRITHRKLDELIRSGQLEAIRLGARTVRIRSSALQRLLANGVA